MATEQLGTGNTEVANTVAGDLLVGGSVGFNGVTSAPAKVTINTFTVSVTTTADAGINAILLLLKNLGLIDSDAS